MASTATSRFGGAPPHKAALRLPCKAATTRNIRLSGAQIIDGVSITAGNRVLVKDQDDETENGIYVADAAAWSRAKDFDGADDALDGALVFVHSGTRNEGFWRLTAGTNLLTYSEALDNAAWSAISGTGATVSDNVATAPDGTGTADKIIEGTATAQPQMYQSVAIAAGVTYTFSVYAKAAERGHLLLTMADGAVANKPFAVFDLSDGSVTASGTTGSATASVASAEDAGGGWWRCRLTGIVGGNSTTLLATVGPVSDATGAAYTGDGASGVYVWGAQLVEGTIPGVYVATEAAAVTDADLNIGVTKIEWALNDAALDGVSLLARLFLKSQSTQEAWSGIGLPRNLIDNALIRAHSTNNIQGTTAWTMGDSTDGAALDGHDSVLQRAELKDYGETINALGTISTGAVTVDLETGGIVTATFSTTSTGTGSTATTWTFSNPSSAACSWSLIAENAGKHSHTWPSAVKWPNGAAPSLTSSGKDVLGFLSIDAGVTWYAFKGGIDMR